MPAKKDIDFENKIRRGIACGLTDPEIARKLGVSKNSVSCYRYRWIGPNPNYRKRIIKYDKDFTLKFVKFYRNHTHKECAKEFGLTLNEVKSLLTRCYRKAQPYKDIRKKFIKDTRRKDKWPEWEIKKMLQMTGLRPRAEIAKKIKRGNHRVIKEKLINIGIKAPKYLNGLTLNRYRDVFGKDPDFYVETDAGPGRDTYSATFFKIVPWVYIKDAIDAGEIKTASAIEKWVFAMADFQEWFHEGNAYANILDITSQVKNKVQKGRLRPRRAF